MSTNNTTRVSLRLRTDVFDAIQQASSQAGIDPSAFMQRALERAVSDYLPEELRKELDNMEVLYAAAQEKARQVYNAGRFDEHFTLTVFRELMENRRTRDLYEEIIGVDAYTNGAPKKTPLNMYLGWYIKNAIDAEPLLDDAGKPRRAFIQDEPIKSYTLLQVASAAAPVSAKKVL